MFNSAAQVKTILVTLNPIKNINQDLPNNMAYFHHIAFNSMLPFLMILYIFKLINIVNEKAFTD